MNLSYRFAIALFVMLNMASFLYAQTMTEEELKKAEIASADLSQLVSMLKEAGLDTTGRIDDLRSRLYRHYEIEIKQERSTNIDHADSLYYGQIAGLGQSTATFSGSVQMTIKDGDQNHQIFTQKLVVNQKTQLITASGGVVYIMGSGSTQKRFTANSMAFESDQWKSLLIQVTGQTSITPKNKTNNLNESVQIYYRAENLIKTKDNFIMGDGVLLTSCDEPDPHFKIKAGHIWVLNDHEAVMQNAVLSMGHVPIFYFPGYYHGTDILPFNPVIGVRSREGVFYNTTSYLYGKPASDVSDLLSFNFFTENTDEEASTNFVKLMADYYSRLGIFTGLSGAYEPLNLEFLIGLGFSRTLYDDMFIYSGDKDVKQEINTSTWFGRTLPFRFGQQFSLEANDVTLHLENYSDPFFAEDFLFRYEQAAWFGFLASFGTDNPYEPIYETDNTFEYSKNWNLGLPGLSEISIDYAKIEINSKVFKNNLISNTDSPNRYFFAPKSFNLPNVKVSANGQWQIKIDDTSNMPELVAQDAEPNFDLVQKETDKRTFDQALFYEVEVNERIFYEPNSSDWLNPEDLYVPFDDFRNSTFSRLNVGFESQSSDKMWKFRSSLQTDVQYLALFNQDAISSPADINYVKKENYTSLGNKTEIGFFPLVDFPYWEQTGFNYQLNTTFLRYQYDTNTKSYDTTWQFKPNLHHVTGQVRYDTGLWWAYASTNSDIPTAENLKNLSKSGMGVDFWHFKNEFYVYYYEGLNDFDASGYGLFSEYKPVDFFAIYQTTELSFESKLESVRIGTKLYGLSVNFIWEEIYLYTFDRSYLSWKPVRDSNGDHAHGFHAYQLDSRLDQDISIWKSQDEKSYVNLKLRGQFVLDFQRYTESFLQFGLGFNVTINEWLELYLATSSRNDAMYLYFPFMRDALGITTDYSFFADLWDSFSFWDIDARKNSNFKLDSIDFGITVNMHDWTISFLYSGWPDISAYQVDHAWYNSFSFLITWNIIPSINSQINYDTTRKLYRGAQM